MNYPKTTYLQLLTSLWLFSLLGSCTFDPPEPLFGYMQLNKVIVATTPDQGTGSNGITEAWIFADGVDIGVYPIPGLVPVPAGDSISIVIFAGMRIDDRRVESTINPMYQELSFTKMIMPDQTDTIDLVFKYKDDVVISFLEDFEDKNGFVDNLDTSNLSVSSIKNIPATEPFHGQYDGSFELNDRYKIIELGHRKIIEDLNIEGRPIFFEFDCKNEALLAIGLLGINQNETEKLYDIGIVRPSEEWKKVYIDLTRLLNERTFVAYQVVIYSIYEPTEEVPQVRFVMDNIKLLHL